ncbi:CvpA family protein [Oscillospiraceae bacterium 21-37]|nr:CvpA family protein [Acutalibacter sp.]
MNYVLDLVLFGVFVLFVAMGVFRGFIRSAIHFLGSIIAACLSAVLGGMAAQWLFDSMFRGALVERVQESLNMLGTSDALSSVDNLLASLPDFIVRALQDAGVTASSISGSIVSGSSAAAERIADLLAPTFVGFLKVLAVIVIFALLMVVVRILAEVLSHVLRLPVLGQLDSILGGVCGFLLALVLVWVMLAAAQVFVPMLDASTQSQIHQALEDSIVAGIFVNINPLGHMFTA